MKILVIFTGGTIQSSVGKEYISLDEKKKYALLNNFNNNSNIDVEFDVECPYSILSENLSGKELTVLSKLVESKISLGYDGIIVTHGTDTLQYTASALAYTVDTKNVPVVLVSANYPLENKLSNGNDNFLGAVEFISKHKKGGVFVSYRNSLDGPVEFFYATRIVSHNEASDTVCSIDGISYGEYVKGENSIIKFNDLPKLDGKGAIGLVDFVPSPKILFINSVPGDSFDYDIDKYNAVLIKPYHSGTLNTHSENLVKFCKLAKEKKIPIFIPNVRGGKNYDSTELFDTLSLVVLPLSTIPAIYVKLWIAISLNKDLNTFMLDEIMGEFID